METVVRNADDLTTAERLAAAQLIGHALTAGQKLVIQVIDAGRPSSEVGHSLDEDRLPAWFNVYEALTDEQITVLERAISRRPSLTRALT